MERLSHDLNLALEESNCGKQGRKKFGLRRRTRSTGNLCEDGSSSSPSQQAIVSNILSDSDDPQLNHLQQGNTKNRIHFCSSGNFESDSFNENFSPAKPPNARRKRKFKKMAIDYPDNGRTSPTLNIGPSHVNVQNCSVLNLQGAAQFSLISKKKRIFKHGCQDRSNIFCGKRKWSHRERSESGEMRERSFSGGCASKSYFCGKSASKSFLDFKTSKKYLPIDKVPKFKEKLLAPVKCSSMKNGLETALQNIALSSFGTNQLPGSSSFNFVYRPPTTTCDTVPIFGKPLDKPPSVFSVPFFAFTENDTKNQNTKLSKKHEKSHGRKHKSHKSQNKLRNALKFNDPNIDMDCSIANEIASSSSISSSDSEGVVTNESDREGDDELTDWPGNDEISSFNKNLNLKVQKPISNGSLKVTVQQLTKPLSKKEKFLPKQGLNSCKNKTDTSLKTDSNIEVNAEMQLMDDDTMMFDSTSVLDAFSKCIHSTIDPATLTETYSSFADVKNAGLSNNNANEAFFHSFQAFQDNGKFYLNKDNEQYVPRTNFTLQKTSSSDLNLSEKSPQSDHCYSEHSTCFGPPTIRKLRAGCRRLRDERPGFAILSAANEQLSRFLQDSYQDELKLPYFNNDQEEKEKLASLAKLYSLDMSVELGRPVLRKTSNTTQSVRVEHSRLQCQRFLSFSKFKRRCYDAECTSDHPFSSPSDIYQQSSEENKQITQSIGPEISSTSKSATFSQEPFPTLTKTPTLNDLSQSQDYDQGFSEPSLRNSPHLEIDEIKSHDKSDGGFSSD